MSKFPLKMLPGQTPYTHEEEARLYKLVLAAALEDPGEAAEVYGEVPADYEARCKEKK
jgi:hypothetical protein